MYRVISIEDYMVTRNIRLENSDTGTIDECFDDSSLVSKKYFEFDENEQLEEGVDTMCNLSEGIYNIGKEEGKLEAAKIMIESGMDFNFVAKKLELPRESQ